MKGSRVAIRYAKALLATAQDQQAVDQVADDMESVYTTLENSQELKAVLASPVISAELKGDTLKAIFGKVSPVVKTFLALVAENNRANHLDGVALKYKQLYQELHGLFYLDQFNIIKNIIIIAAALVVGRYYLNQSFFGRILKSQK